MPTTTPSIDCQHCGASAPGGRTYCPECRKKLRPATATPKAKVAPASPARKRTSTRAASTAAAPAPAAAASHDASARWTPPPPLPYDPCEQGLLGKRNANGSSKSSGRLAAMTTRLFARFAPRRSAQSEEI